MPEKELGQIQILWGGAISLLTIIWGVLTKRIIDLPHNYVLKNDYRDDMKSLKKEIKDGFTRVYDKLDEKRDKHRSED